MSSKEVKPIKKQVKQPEKQVKQPENRVLVNEVAEPQVKISQVAESNDRVIKLRPVMFKA